MNLDTPDASELHVPRCSVSYHETCSCKASGVPRFAITGLEPPGPKFVSNLFVLFPILCCRNCWRYINYNNNGLPEVCQHAEYEVSSSHFKSSMYRRYIYIDFVVFKEMLLQKYPYRIVPALPPKKMLGADWKFIESCRRALKRFVNLVTRHPSIWDDILINIFLSDKWAGSTESNAHEFLPSDIQVQFAASTELIRNICNSVYKLRDCAKRTAAWAINNVTHLLVFSKELSALGSDTNPLPFWVVLNQSMWGALEQALKGLSVAFALLADKAPQQGTVEEIDVVEKHEKGVLHKHKKVLYKYSLVKKQMISASVQNKEGESVEQLESRIAEQENAIMVMEFWNFLLLYCLP
uniref:PX domain-containing protein n=1 Tax=Leptobrachium leishanense TaxID=445787 RepID=A0A8C5M7R9_9ANUR